MNGTVTVLAASADTRRGLTIGLFAVFIAITLYITIWASRQNKTAADYYAAGRSFSALQNGLAIGGDYMSAASFLGTRPYRAVRLRRFLYSIGFLFAWRSLCCCSPIGCELRPFTDGVCRRPYAAAPSDGRRISTIPWRSSPIRSWSAGSPVALLLGIATASLSSSGPGRGE